MVISLQHRNNEDNWSLLRIVIMSLKLFMIKSTVGTGKQKKYQVLFSARLGQLSGDY